MKKITLLSTLIWCSYVSSQELESQEPLPQNNLEEQKRRENQKETNKDGPYSFDYMISFGLDYGPKKIIGLRINSNPKKNQIGFLFTMGSDFKEGNGKEYDFSKKLVSETFEDSYQGSITRYSQFRLGLLYRLIEGQFIVAGLSHTTEQTFLNYYDETEILGINGRYHIKGNNNDYTDPFIGLSLNHKKLNIYVSYDFLFQGIIFGIGFNPF